MKRLFSMKLVAVALAVVVLYGNAEAGWRYIGTAEKPPRTIPSHIRTCAFRAHIINPNVQGWHDSYQEVYPHFTSGVEREETFPKTFAYRFVADLGDRFQDVYAVVEALLSPDDAKAVEKMIGNTQILPDNKNVYNVYLTYEYYMLAGTLSTGAYIEVSQHGADGASYASFLGANQSAVKLEESC